MSLSEARKALRGVPTERLRAIVSDIHGNRYALSGVLEGLRSLGIYSNQIWNLGDIFGYGAEPAACVGLVSDFPVNLFGNHDCFVSFERRGILQDVVGGELYEAPSFRVDRLHAELLSNSRLRRYLDRLTYHHIHESLALFVHDSPRSYETDSIPVFRHQNEFDYREAFRIMTECSFRMAFHGHSHVPIIVTETVDPDGDVRIEKKAATEHEFDLEDRTIVDVGSVGQPRDGDPRAAVGILVLSPFGLPTRFLLVRIDYRIERAMRAILAAGYPRIFAERLAEGW